MAKVKPIPEGLHSITAHLVVRGAAQAIEFYKKAFGAVEVSRAPMPDGKTLMHADIKIGDSRLFLVDDMPGMSGCPTTAEAGATTVSFHLYVEDVDAVFNRAVTAGAKVTMPVADMFWGDRFGKLTDPFGFQWSVATHKEDLTPQEMQERQKAAFAQMGKGQP